MSCVTIKSFPNGINVILNPTVPFEQLYIEYAEKFRDSAKFFGNAKRVISFEGRELSELEERALLEAISQYTDLKVLCVVSNDEATDQMYMKAAGSFAGSSESAGQIYKGCIRGNQNINAGSSIVILGDVNPGAIVKAIGSIVVLGTVYGTLEAGINGDDQSFAAALDFKCNEVKVCGETCKIVPKSAGFLRQKPGARIVYIGEDGIDVDEINKDFLMNLPF